MRSLIALVPLLVLASCQSLPRRSSTLGSSAARCVDGRTGADVDRETVKIQSVQLSEDARQARLFVERLREGSVYELRVANIGPDGRALHPAEAHYTLNQVPAD